MVRPQASHSDTLILSWMSLFYLVDEQSDREGFVLGGGGVYLNTDLVHDFSPAQACVIAVQNPHLCKTNIPCQREHALPLWLGKRLSFVFVLLDLTLHYIFPPGAWQCPSH